MNAFDLKITVREIKGVCPLFSVGDSFVLQQGYKLKQGNLSAICMHALSSILPYHVALSHNVSAKELGLNAKDENKAFVQCLDPCERTGGGTVIFEIEVLK
ncbi:MAG: TIGR04076 family protein [Calditrichaeota bacterium]|nr:TIGR04076 family protein [Calditrichota bacterium]